MKRSSKTQALSSHAQATLRKLLRAAGLSVPRAAEAALTAWATWTVAIQANETPATIERARILWRRRLNATPPHVERGKEAAAVTQARQRNLLALTLGIGGVSALARRAGRSRYHYQRIMEGVRDMGARSARGLEEALLLEAGWLDRMDRPLQDGVQAGARLSVASAPASQGVGKPRPKAHKAVVASQSSRKPARHDAPDTPTRVRH